MITHYRHIATGTIYRPGQIVDGQQTHARMSDDAWAALGCEPYTPPDPPPSPSEAETLAATYPALPATVRAALAALQRLVAFGVTLDLSAGLPGWQDIGPAIAARRQQITSLADYAALDAAADAADGHWRAVEYWCGSSQTAYRLAPELAAMGV